ncbi:MAG TPA: D-glycerate dehydrogenase [Acidimicrobiales bacterium]|nr:D-glycerate dehydrogenase [Acidimicrobiales bacterium]
MRGAGEDGRLVFVSRHLPGDALDRLAKGAEVDLWEDDLPPPRAALLERTRGADGLVVMSTERVDAELLDACERLRVVATVSVGYDHVDVPELTARGIPFGNTPGVLTNATADITWALILAVARRVVEARDAVLEGKWVSWDPVFMLGKELAGAVIGIVGVGRIGEAVARRAAGFDMHVLGWSRSRREVPGVETVALDELLARSDVVSVNAALTAETHHLIGARELSLMKPDAILVNTARGPIVDQAALAEALGAHRIGGAGLDVTEVEPIPLDDPLLTLDNCVVLPHIGSATLVTRSRMARLAVDNVLAGLAGERLPNCVNPDVYA